MHESILYRFPFSWTCYWFKRFCFFCLVINHYGITDAIFMQNSQSQFFWQTFQIFITKQRKNIKERSQNNHKFFTKQRRKNEKIPSALISLTNCSDKKASTFKKYFLLHIKQQKNLSARVFCVVSIVADKFPDFVACEIIKYMENFPFCWTIKRCDEKFASEISQTEKPGNLWWWKWKSVH